MQNVSHAVMNQRHEAKDSLDFFPTPPWATRALCEWIRMNDTVHMKHMVAWEPACGAGDMAKTLKEYFGEVSASDIDPQGYGDKVDFFDVTGIDVDWIITNPPFNKGEEFALHAHTLEPLGIALFTRLNFLESVGRYKNLFCVHPPSHVLVFTERVPIHKGKLTKTGSTATAYCWIVWRRKYLAAKDTQVVWIPPCRRRLEKDSDYD
jgi:hypothetical protein